MENKVVNKQIPMKTIIDLAKEGKVKEIAQKYGLEESLCVDTNKVIAKDILDFPFVSNIQNIGDFYNVYDLYKKFYKDEDLDYMNNPSSGNSSSMNFSSQFK